MPNDSKNLHPPRSVEVLIKRLLRESFAQENHLPEATFQNVEEVFEETEEMINGGENPFSLDEIKQSYETCKAIYCSLLMELEGKESSLPMETPLEELVDLDDSPEPNTPERPNIVLLKDPENENIEDLVVDTDADDIETLEQDILEDERSTELNLIPTRPQATPSSTANPHLKMADYFFSPNPSAKPTPVDLGAAQRTQFGIQCLMLAVERICHTTFTPLLERFAKHKDNAIRSLISSKLREYEFHPIIAKGLAEIEKNYGDWLYRKTLPQKQMIQSLRELLVEKDVSKIEIGILDAANLLFFFGQDKILNGFPLRNFLNAQGLNELQITELTCRLYRCHSNLILAAHQKPDTSPRDDCQEDVTAIFTLVAKLTFSDRGRSSTEREI